MFSETAKFHAKINHAKQTSQMERLTQRNMKSTSRKTSSLSKF